MAAHNTQAGDELTIEYENTQGGTTEVTAEVERVEELSGDWAGVDTEFTEVYFTDETAAQAEREWANRRVTFRNGEVRQVEGKNGGRWNRLSAAGGDITVTTENEDTEDPTEVEEGDQVEITDPATGTVVCEGEAINVTPGWFTLSTDRGPRHFDYAPDGEVEASDTANRYVVTSIRTPMTDGGEETYTFQTDSESESEDALQFTVTSSFENSYGDQKAVVQTPAPWDTPDDLEAANEVVKALEWDDYHYKFDQDREAWTLDADGLRPLKELAEDAGYEWETQLGADSEDDESVPEAFRELLQGAREGDHVTVEYAKKNGNGLNTYEGEVETLRTVEAAEGSTDSFGHSRTPGLLFRDSSDRTKTVRLDDAGTTALYSSGYHPFMGEVTQVTVRRA